MIRLSHSALDVLHVCERKFQLERLLTSEITEKEEWPSTVFGRAYGEGVASYMVDQDLDKAIFRLYMAYWPILEEERKTQEICISLLLSSIPHLDNLLMDWEVAIFNNKPAVELSFCLDIDERFYFVGYIDLVLKNKWTGIYGIMEVKHTGLNIFDLSPLYQNSGQALGYSIVLDKIVGEAQSNYEVLYLAGQLGSGNGFTPKIHTMIYPKTLQDRLNWFITLGMDVERLHMMLENNVFPLRGSNCLQYMKPCKHLGTCNLHGLDVYKEEIEDTIVYDFNYKLDEVIQDHLVRISNT